MPWPDKEASVFASESPHPRRFALRARLLLPMAGPPLDGGVITIEQDRIVAVGENLTTESPRDCGDVAIMPGLVNAHTHLELSCFDMPLGEPGMRFPAWINTLVTRRRQQVAAADDLGRADRRRGVEKGLMDSVQAGVTTVADVTTWDASELPAARPAMRHCLLRELMGLSADAVARHVTVAHKHLRQRDALSGDRDYGLSPHAPYSTALDLVEQAVRLCRHTGSMVAMHLAESEEELELLSNGGGQFREVLEALGAWTERAFSAGLRPLDYLQRLRVAPRALIIHGNYLSLAEWQVLTEERKTMSVVYCPRTHHFFRHARYPLSRLLLSGVQVAI
ncbi:MAG: amidohydrolase family protein, partial [Solirubrobacterales bacterium]|nr:amidohydrolase family protein [Solirubrobacterales bacterium]